MKAHLKNRLSVAVGLALMVTSNYGYSQEGNENGEIEKINVTGSRIKRNMMEGINPITTLSSEDIIAQGHATVFDALNALSINTGIFIGEENSNNFNANAQSLNLRGFGPGYTLVLINGRRVPVLPKPSNAVAGNVVNLAMIPTEAIERVEVLSGGASAIYGSDAVAGVVNFIMKKDYDGTLAKYRYGDTKDGGGSSHRFNFMHGAELAGGSFMAGVEIHRIDPIYGNDRDWFDEPTDSPNPERHALPQVMSYWSRYDPDSFNLIDISDSCAAQGYTADSASWVRPFRGETDPQWCGDNTYDTYTIRNKRDRNAAFLRFEYPINSETTLSIDTLISNSNASAGVARYSYALDYDVVEDDADVTTGNSQWVASRQIYRSFRDEETGTSNQEYDETSYTLITSLQGWAWEDFEYSVDLTLSKYDYEDSIVRFDDQVMMSALLGEKGVDWDQPWEGSRWVVTKQGNLNSMLQPSLIDFFGTLSPSTFEDALYTSKGKGDSHTYNFSASLAGDLYTLPAGELQFAAVFEFINEGYEFITDSPTVNGDIYGWSGIVGEGERNHYALGAELLIPLLGNESPVGSLDATAAARYDKYNDKSSVGGALTYQLGLSWRPTENLLFRSSGATSFRAPDMHLLYAQPSSSFNSGIDYLSCVTNEGIQPGESWANCSDNYGTGSIRQLTEGDVSLKEETGFSVNVGVVADLTANWDLSVDYYKIRLEDQVGLVGVSTVLLYEAECLLGFSQYEGEQVDPNSARCQEMVNRVSRNGRSSGEIDGVSTVANKPFNTGLREQSGMDIASRYNLSNTEYGNFYVDLRYTHIFETLSRFLPEDDIVDIRDLAYNNEFRTRTNLTLGWYNDEAWVTVFANRLGTSPVRYADEPERYPSWTRINLSGGYQFSDAIYATVSINNLFNEKPHQHESEEYWPFADISKYNPVGTEYFVTIGYKF
jgi:iron complex outermembrane receptor protein